MCHLNYITEAAVGAGQTEEEIFAGSQVSDEALETAAGSMKGKTAAFTLSFCSGLDSCPA